MKNNFSRKKNNKREYKKNSNSGKRPHKFERDSESYNKKREYKKSSNSSKRPHKFDRKKEFYDKKEDYKREKNQKYKSNDEPELIRLNKFIANSGVCSRREADELIKNGLITVNGEIVNELGYKIKPTDVVVYKGKKLKGEKTVYVVMNKPKNYITTMKDPEGRHIVTELFKGEIKERIYPVGRLDRNTTGVLLFTNDGDLATKLMHPSAQIPKIYVATLDKNVSQADIKKLIEGFELEDGEIYADSAYYLNDSRRDKIIIEIHSGRNRIVRRMFEHLGYDVKNLDRIEFAGITKKDLKRGQWRFLNNKEIGFLKMTAGKLNINKK